MKIMTWLQTLLPKERVSQIKIVDQLPKEFIATRHAVERMKERFKCNEGKIEKILFKAWSSREKVDTIYAYRKTVRGYTNTYYRVYMGYVFVFKVGHSFRDGLTQKLLITAYNYRKPKISRKYGS